MPAGFKLELENKIINLDDDDAGCTSKALHNKENRKERRDNLSELEIAQAFLK